MGLFRTALAKEKKQEGEEVYVPASNSNNADQVSTRMVLPEAAFMSMLYLERRRAERSQKRYVLLLVDVKGAISDKQRIRTIQKITGTLCAMTRETDIIGWYVNDHILGVIATEIGRATSQEVRQRMSDKIRTGFLEALGPDRAAEISISFHFFPEEREDGDFNDSQNNALYPEINRKTTSRKVALGMKRVMDVCGSGAAIFLLLPLMAIIAAIIKLTSKGPVLFSQ